MTSTVKGATLTAIQGNEEFERLDLTPDPRILEVLGDIPYQPWQCLAELVDNSFDEVLADPDRDGEKAAAVYVVVPRANSSADGAQVSVYDGGRGMSREALEKALRAGYTGKARFGSLGLFGMGFNIATARLGNRTEVRTTQAGDDRWLVTEIDFKEMRRRENFHVPLRYEAKEDPTAHGTEIIISDLSPKMFEALRRPNTISAIRQRLGRVYSYLLRDANPIPGVPDQTLAGQNIALNLNGKRIEPWVPCVWSASRTVAYKGAEITAVQTVDHKLSDAYACMRCGHWQRHNDMNLCTECGGETLERRTRRIHGWLGVQRYLHDSEYGIDFLRNGRKILTDEKTLFTWEDFESGATYLEYPIDLPHNEGRLVGEIHLDHVPVVYQKTDFERGSTEWIAAVEFIRGAGPMREQKAKDRKYPENESPLGRLFKAFQNNRPGLKCLIPGNGYHATHEQAREWGNLFHRGVPEYLSDEKWYEAAARHDEVKARERAGGRNESEAGGGQGNLSGRTGLTPLPPTRPLGSPQPTTPLPAPAGGETEDERFARYRKDSQEFYDLAGEIGVPGIGKRDVRVFETTVSLVNASGITVPVVSRAGTAMNLEVYVNGDHQVFREFGRDPRDYAIMEIAQSLRALAGTSTPITAVTAEVTTQFPDQRSTASALRDRADATLRRLRDLIVPVIAGRAAEMWASLPNDFKIAAERNAAQADPGLDWRVASHDGQFASYMSCEAIAILVRHAPDAFLDGAVFTSNWSGWSNQQIRDRQVSQVARLLETVGEFLADIGPKTRQELAMARLSIDMLDQAVTRAE